jgi:hypothetical protein
MCCLALQCRSIFATSITQIISVVLVGQTLKVITVSFGDIKIFINRYSFTQCVTPFIIITGIAVLHSFKICTTENVCLRSMRTDVVGYVFCQTTQRPIAEEHFFIFKLCPDLKPATNFTFWEVIYFSSYYKFKLRYSLVCCFQSSVISCSCSLLVACLLLPAPYILLSPTS